MSFLVTKVSRVLEKKVKETQASKTVSSHLKKSRRRRQGRLENEFIYYLRISRTLKSFTLFIIVKTKSNLNLEHNDKFEMKI